MIIVLDTNVIISALLSSEGPPARIIDRWQAEEFDVAISESLLDELERALAYPKVGRHLDKTGVKGNAVLNRLRHATIVVEPQERLDVIPQDPQDNRVVECAVAAGASFIISGDGHLLSLKEYQGIQILPPAGFIVFLDL